MKKELREYQEEACDKALEKLKKGENFLLNMATGSGKTVVFLNIVNEYLKQGKKVLILVNDNSLLQQNISNIKEELEIKEKDIAVEHGEFHDIINDINQENSKKISISTRSTMAYTGPRQLLARYDMIPSDAFDLIIIDEAHHMVSPQYQQILNRFKSTPVLGVTATPQLANEINISSKYFNNNEYSYGIKKAMLDNNLAHVKVKNYKIPELINKINNIKENKNTEDFGDDIVEKIISEDSIKKQFIDIIGENAKEKKATVFCPTVEYAKEIAKIVESKYPEFKVFVLHSKMENKERIKEEYEKAGKNTIMINVSMLTEGYDCKDIDCIVNLRATKSEVLYRQIAGRETRTAEGKLFGTFINVYDGCDKVLQPNSLMRESNENKDSPVMNLMQKILDDKKMDDLLEVRLKAEQMLKYIEKYNVELTYKDENKFGLKTEKTLEQLEKEILEKDYQSEINSLKNPLFKNLKIALDNIKTSDFKECFQEDKLLLNKIGFKTNHLQLNSTASVLIDEIKKICIETGRSQNDIAEAIKIDNKIFQYNYRLKSYFKKDISELKEKLSEFALCNENTFEKDLEKIQNIRINFADETYENGTEEENKALDLIGLNKNVFASEYQKREVIKIVNENRKQAKTPTIEECLQTAKTYNLYSSLNKIAADDISYLAELDKEYRNNNNNYRIKKDIDDALQLIKKKLEKTPQVRKSVTESQKNGNNINKKGGGIKHG